MRSTEEWKFWGRYDPMWAVATWKGRERDGAQPWTIGDFRASGRSDCADIMRHWDHYGRKRGGVCIEIGCGSGESRPTSSRPTRRSLPAHRSAFKPRFRGRIPGRRDKNLPHHPDELQAEFFFARKGEAAR